MHGPELLAPAGSFECLRAACDHGADVVYVGIGRYNLRAGADNFSIEELDDAIGYVHGAGRRIYAALNAMPDDAMLGELERMLQSLSARKVRPDALIVSDPGVISLCKGYAGNIPLHLSTQTGCFNSASARFWKQQGIGRIVLPREMTLAQMRAIKENAGIETEAFIHGAMCVSVSGRCLLGAYLAGRHPNRGDCPQPCRLEYRIAPPGQAGERAGWLTVEEDAGEKNQKAAAYILNSKDLNTLPILPAVIATGASALKIEGRNKSARYVASVVKVYRDAIDACLKDPGGYCVLPWWSEELDRLDHRPYTTGFYAGEYRMQETGFSQVRPDVRVVGSVKGLLSGGEAVIDVKNPFCAQDTLDILPVGFGERPYELRLASLTDMNGTAIDRAITNRVVLVRTERQLRVGDMLRRSGNGQAPQAQST